MFADLKCIKCSEADCISLRLDDGTFDCRECNEQFSTEDVASHVAAWQRVLAWTLQAVPVEA